MITTLLLAFTILSFGFTASAQTPQPDGYVNGQPVYCADTDCGIGDGAEGLQDDGEKEVIRIEDNDPRMIPIQGGQAGQDLLQKLLQLQNSENQIMAVRAQLAAKLLLTKWHQNR